MHKAEFVLVSPGQTLKLFSFLFQSVTHHSTREPERVVTENSLGRSIVVLCRDGSDESLDVQLSGAGLLAGGVRALETPGRLPQRRALAQRRVLDVVEIAVQLVRARTGRGE